MIDKNTKFLFIKDGDEEGMLIAEDGGLIAYHHNGQHILGEYHGRIDFEDVKGKYKAQDVLNLVLDDDDYERELFDHEGSDIILPYMLEDDADWMVCPRQGEFFDNLIVIQKKKLTFKMLFDFLLDGKVKEQMENDTHAPLIPAQD